ncbi:hypothetical protein SAMN03080614_10629 [Anaerobranca gottschalkii DSM 13577]|uniref:Uncharacterized protein n=1 Tax=Anaerobranca gottschalkii DSM 13577 TaxID=1120990 RepID=A0A1I0C9G5_9FIRM|nr:hypothetical protein SAMN03080614_10629 [Anaerobranca gottschalkii DSM 13577]
MEYDDWDSGKNKLIREKNIRRDLSWKRLKRLFGLILKTRMLRL